MLATNSTIQSPYGFYKEKQADQFLIRCDYLPERFIGEKEMKEQFAALMKIYDKKTDLGGASALLGWDQQANMPPAVHKPWQTNEHHLTDHP